MKFITFVDPDDIGLWREILSPLILITLVAPLFFSFAKLNFKIKKKDIYNTKKDNEI